MYNVTQFLQDNKIPYKSSGTNVSAGWVEIHCPFPFCRDPSEHMGINLRTSMYNCWKCGEHGSFTKLVRTILRCDWEQAENIASEYFKPSLLTEKQQVQQAKTFAYPKEATDKLPQLHKDYLRNRGFDPKILQRQYELKACYLTGKFAYRIIIPIIMFGRPVSFTARDVTNTQKTRYKNMSNAESIVPTKQCVYGIDEVAIGDSILLVEGIFVKWRIGKNCLAMMGTEYTLPQIKVIVAKKPKIVYVMLDKGAEKISRKLSAILAPHVKEVQIIGLPEYEDYDDMTQHDVKLFRKELAL